MSLESKFKAAVEKAFSAADDLVKPATLYSEITSGFDFSSNETNSVKRKQEVEVILQTTKKVINNKYVTEVLMRSGYDMSVYDFITIDRETFNILDYSDNGFVITLMLTREG
jgi:hypothetical protein